MRAELEPLAGVLRVWEAGKSRPHPYLYHITVRWVTHERVELMTITEPPSMKEVAAMAVALDAAGVKTAYWQRYRDGMPRKFEVNITALARRVHDRRTGA